MSRGFEFRESWTVAAPRDRVHALLIDLEHYPDWWPQVCAVAKVDDDHAWVLCRSRLPYTLDVLLTAVHREPGLLETAIGGDLSARSAGGSPTTVPVPGSTSSSRSTSAARCYARSPSRSGRCSPGTTAG